MRNFVYRLLRFEFWPWWALFIPLFPVYLWGVIRTRSWLYFTAVNPAIPLGGFFGEEKEDILEHIPQQFRPKDVLVQADEDGLEAHLHAGLTWPCILKPNVGERGYLVERAESPDDLIRYQEHGIPYLIQEYIDLPEEYGILVHSDGKGGKLTSLCKKEFMTVHGDGKSSVGDLVARHPRHRIYLDMLEEEHPNELTVIPAQGTAHIVHQIGNHSKGTRFLNHNSLVDARLNATFVDLIDRIEGFDYGRFDVRTASLEALQNGDFKVFEFNGVSSDPGHIFDLPTVFHAYKALAEHWMILIRLARINMKKGVQRTPSTHFLKQVSAHFFA